MPSRGNLEVHPWLTAELTLTGLHRQFRKIPGLYTAFFPETLGNGGPGGQIPRRSSGREPAGPLALYRF